MGDSYPKRESHFAHRFVRLLIRTCAAQEIGTDAAYLLTIVAHTEDAKRYRAPVTYWNGQLMQLLGYEHAGRLIRCRDKAVAAGWLHYECGGKGRVGKYWVEIPPQFRGMKDGASDCDATIYLSMDRKPNGRKGDLSILPIESQAEEKRKRSGREVETQTETFFPIPNPNPNPNPNTNTPQPLAAECFSQDFDAFWKAFPPLRRNAKRTAWKAWLRAIKRAKPSEIIAAAVEYSASEVGRGQYAKGPTPWLNGDSWNDDRRAWNRSAPRDASIPF